MDNPKSDHLDEHTNGTSKTNGLESSEIIHNFDVLIIGAGISGINTAYRVQTNLPGSSYVVLEGRDNLGGTWDLMRYPGIRSDSDLHTFGFGWRPWTEKIPIAEGALIVKYMKECTAECGLDKHILYRHKVKEARWCSREQVWNITVEATNVDNTKIKKRYRCRFLVLGTGYYDYDKVMEARIPGLENFKGPVVHPQFWPQDLDYVGKKIAVIGSGATAITLIPALAQKAEKVTMVQRSPGYVISFPNRVQPKSWWEKLFPVWVQHRITRLKYLIGGFYYRRFFSAEPEKVKMFLEKLTTAQLPKHIPYDPHFKPSYVPWSQRLCLCPDGDFFKSLHSGHADVATGIIQTVNDNSVILESGQNVDADIIVTATGLRVSYGGNAEYYVDGERIHFGEKFLWRGMMVQDMPNCAMVMGYAKASWTLGADATATMVCRMIKHMERNNLTSATPRIPKPEAVKQTAVLGLMGLTSTYIMSAMSRIPKTSDTAPWKERGDYLSDMWDAQYGSLKAGIQFTLAPGS